MVKKMTREKLRDYQGPDNVVSSFELEEILKQEKTEEFVVYGGIPTLDRLTEGFSEGELIVVSGPTKSGKTLFCQTLTNHFSKKDEAPLWFSYEMPAKQFLKTFPRTPYFFMPAQIKAHSLDWFEDRCIESYEKHQNRIIFIDHLHFLFDMARVKNSSLEIGMTVRRIKRLCVENGFIAFLVCHIGKIAKDLKPTYHNLRDSSFIAQESDTCLMLQRIQDKEERKNQAVLKVEFHRRTGVLEELVWLHKVNGYLREELPE